MIFIKKNTEPKSLINWKKSNPGRLYNDLPSPLKREIRNSLLKEQGFVCCFCGTAIGKKESDATVIQVLVQKGDLHNTRNAHIIPQSQDRAKTLDYSNICASCDSSPGATEKHCDIAQKDSCLPVSPLQHDCLSFFSFSVDGTIFPNPDKSPEDQVMAKETIKTLGLAARILNSQRDAILKIAEDCLRKNTKYLDNLSKKDRNGCFAPFYFVPLCYYQADR